MKFTVEYNPDFFNDIAQAVNWYNEKQAGLGDRLFNNVRKQTAKLSTSALHFAVKYDDVRCMCIEKFPYLLHYRVNEFTKKKPFSTQAGTQNYGKRGKTDLKGKVGYPDFQFQSIDSL